MRVSVFSVVDILRKLLTPPSGNSLTFVHPQCGRFWYNRRMNTDLIYEDETWFFGVFSGDSDHGIPGNAFGGTESGYWKYVLSTSSRYRLARLEIYRTRRRTSTLGYAQNLATLMMDKCQRVARRSLSCCIQCPANAGFCVFRG